MARITGNTTDLVCDVLALLAAQAVHCDLFGGWAEEVSDTNLILYRAEHRSTQPHRWRHPSSRLTTMLMDRAIR